MAQSSRGKRQLGLAAAHGGVRNEMELDTPGALLRAYQHRAKKRFGQHFLVDPRILEAIADVADIGEGDRVLEIGPGCGTLTLTMLQRGARVTAVEIDREAIAFLKQTIQPENPLKIIEGDVLRADLGEVLGVESGGQWKCVSNLPYNVATEVLFRLADRAECFACMALMFQREVADRIVAKAGSSDYGVLSLMSRLYFDAERVMVLPPGAFVPPPKVESAVVRLVPVAGTRIPDEARRRFFVRLVKTAFQARRKTLANAVKPLKIPKNDVLTAMTDLGIEPNARPEVVDFETYVSLAGKLMILA